MTDDPNLNWLFGQQHVQNGGTPYSLQTHNPHAFAAAVAEQRRQSAAADARRSAASIVTARTPLLPPTPRAMNNGVAHSYQQPPAPSPAPLSGPRPGHLQLYAINVIGAKLFGSNNGRPYIQRPLDYATFLLAQNPANDGWLEVDVKSRSETTSTTMGHGFVRISDLAPVFHLTERGSYSDIIESVGYALKSKIPFQTEGRKHFVPRGGLLTSTLGTNAGWTILPPATTVREVGERQRSGFLNLKTDSLFVQAQHPNGKWGGVGHISTVHLTL